MTKIAAVIATYNRANLLLRCLDAINRQTVCPQMIYVANNASTDNTMECLRRYRSGIPLEIIDLPTNQGGSGGFYAGMKAAFDSERFDGFWVMDDDGYPAPDCLKRLCGFLERYDYVAPLVLDEDNQEQLAFPCLKDMKLVSDFHRVFGATGLIQDYSCPFNGILISSKAVGMAGFPKKDMFIWGDEFEYNLRLKKNGFIPVTVINAFHFHPGNRQIMEKDILGRKSVIFNRSKLRDYCTYRNKTYNLKIYGPKKRLYKIFIKYNTYFLFKRKFDIENLRLFNRAFFDGLRSDFSRHNDYL